MTTNSKNSFVLSTTSYRGGVGKSMIALNLAHALARLDKKILLVEADFLAPSLEFLLSDITAKKGTWNDYLLGEVEWQRITITYRDFEVIMTKSDDDRIFERFHDRDTWRDQFSKQITTFLRQATGKYDLVIFDNQAGKFLSTLTHAFYSDYLITVLRPNLEDVKGTLHFVDLIQADFYLIWNFFLPSLKSHVKQWETSFQQVATFQGVLGTLPFDEATALQRWVEGKAIMEGTPFEREIMNAANKLLSFLTR